MHSLITELVKLRLNIINITNISKSIYKILMVSLNNAGLINLINALTVALHQPKILHSHPSEITEMNNS